MEMEMEMERVQFSSTKTERKIIEKNRRNHMKTLYYNLNSLLPAHSSKEALSLPDQIDASVAHIKSLETELKSLRERKQSLMGTRKKKRCLSDSDWSSDHETTLKSPKMEIHETGSNLEVALVTGLDNDFIFSEIITMFHEEGVDVVHASFSVVGNSIFHTFRAQVGEDMFGYGAARVTERLKRYVNGSSSSEGETETEAPLNTWDFQILDTWDQF